MIILKKFNSNSEVIHPPTIEELNLDSLSQNDLSQLESFLEKKIIWAETDMTEDERAIGDKLFSPAAIDEFRGQRNGMNYSFKAGLLLFTSLLFLSLSPVVIINLLCAGTSLGAIWVSLSSATKKSSTKWDKIYLNTASVFFILTLVSTILFYIVN